MRVVYREKLAENGRAMYFWPKKSSQITVKVI